MTKVDRRSREGFWQQFVRVAFSQQMTSLLLVVAVSLLAYVTVQARTAASGARLQSVTNNRLIQAQDDAARTAELARKEAAVENAKLAADTVNRLMVNADESDRKNFARLTGQLLQTQRLLIDAITDLQKTLERYVAEDRARDRRAPCPRSVLCELPKTKLPKPKQSQPASSGTTTPR